MQKTIEQSVKISEDQVRQGAYQAWENEGRPAGRDLQFWLDAEARLGAVQKAVAEQPTAETAVPVAPAPLAAPKPSVVTRVAKLELGRKQTISPGSRPKRAKA